MNSFRYLLAVDPSLACSGWALFSATSGAIISVGKIRGGASSIPLQERLSTFHIRIEELYLRLGLGEQDVVVCEAPTTMRDPHNAIKVEQVRGIFETVARSRGMRVPGRVNPRSVQFEVMGLSGKQLKRAEVKLAAVRTIQYLYADQLERIGFSTDQLRLASHQDIVDAVLVGRLALMRVEAVKHGGGTLEAMFASAAQKSRRSWRVKSCAV